MAKKTKVIIYVWAIAYINHENIGRIDTELRNHQYTKQGITSYIPTIKLLKKKFKGKNQFDTLPLLFNYGFFRIPLSNACDADWLMEFKKNISGIYGWVKDPLLTPKDGKGIPKKNGFEHAMKNIDFSTNLDLSIPLKYYTQCALATNEEIENLIESEKLISLYNKSDIDSLEVGQLIRLRGYPFAGIDAEVIDINHKKEYIKVRLEGLEGNIQTAEVSFANVLYTAYSGFETDLTNNLSIDDRDTGVPGMIDKVYFENWRQNGGDY